MSAGAAAEVRRAPGPKCCRPGSPGNRRCCHPAQLGEGPGTCKGCMGGGHGAPPAQQCIPDRRYLNLHQLWPWLAVRRGSEALVLSYITIMSLESLTHVKSIYKDLLAVLSIWKYVSPFSIYSKLAGFNLQNSHWERKLGEEKHFYKEFNQSTLNIFPTSPNKQQSSSSL